MKLARTRAAILLPEQQRWEEDEEASTDAPKNFVGAFRRATNSPAKQQREETQRLLVQAQTQLVETSRDEIDARDAHRKT